MTGEFLRLRRRDDRIRELEDQVQTVTNENVRLRTELSDCNLKQSQATNDLGDRLSSFVSKVAGSQSKFANEARRLLLG